MSDVMIQTRLRQQTGMAEDRQEISAHKITVFRRQKRKDVVDLILLHEAIYEINIFLIKWLFENSLQKWNIAAKN